jgi:DNA-directed RNA polymerase subunit RPC12/RpoP
MAEVKTIDHWYVKDEVVCPHCGHAYEDTDFCADQCYDGHMLCDECEQEFEYEAEFEIYWTTKKVMK